MRLPAACLLLACVAALPAQASSFLILQPAQSDASPSFETIAPIPFARETFSALKAAGAAAAADPKAPAADTAITVAPSASMVVIEPLPLSPETRKAIREAEATRAAAAANHSVATAPASPIPVTPSASMVVLGDPAPQVDPTATVASIGSRAALPTIFRGGVISTSASPPAVPVPAAAQPDPESPATTEAPGSDAAASTDTEAATEASPPAAQ